MKKKVYILIGIVIVGLSAGGWFYFGRTKPPVYASVVVQPTTLVQEVNVTGNIKPSRDLNLSLKRSGQIVSLPAAVGQTVPAGALLLELKTSDEKRTVAEAELALASAKLALDKLLNPIKQQATADKLKLVYEDGLATAATVYANLYQILDDLDDIFFGDDLSGSSTNNKNNIQYYVDIVDYYDPRFKTVPAELAMAYRQIIDSYGPALTEYQTARRGGADVTAERAILTTHDLVKNTANLIKSGRDVILFFNDRSIADSWQVNKVAIVSGHLTDLAAHYATVNGYWLDLLATVNTIKAEHGAMEVTDLDRETARLEIKQKESALAEAWARLDDSYLRAPFAAVITKIEPEIGELVTANSSVLTLISANQLLLETNVPEADLAKIKIGDPAQVTLDAYGADLVFAAQVSAIDPAATLIDGVVTYRTTLRFLKFDPRIKSGLTAEINISTAERSAVLAVPERAVISRGGRKFIRVLTEGAVTEQTVQTGLRGSDGRVEITSGLKPGAEVIVFSPD